MNIAVKTPIVTTVELPLPPSTNRLRVYSPKRKKEVRSETYETWIKAADNIALAFAQLRGVQLITGHFTAEITLSASQRRSDSDCDNRIKALLDWAVTRRLIQDDRYCDRVSCEWGFAPHGCKLVLMEVIA